MGSNPIEPAYNNNMTEIQEKIVELRKEGLTYKEIQLKLGNPSKKFIRDTLLEFKPSLVGDVVKNYHKLNKQL